LIEAPLKTINIRLKAIGKIREIAPPQVPPGQAIPENAFKKSRQVFLEGRLIDARVVERGRLLCGHIIPGPAIIEEPYHVTIVMPGQEAGVDRYGNLIIETGAE
jgi:N-methylhydantoinase A